MCELRILWECISIESFSILLSSKFMILSVTKIRGGLYWTDFWTNWGSKPNKDNPKPCSYILISLTPHGEARLKAAPPHVLSIALEDIGMVLDCPCFALEAQLVQRNHRFGEVRFSKMYFPRRALQRTPKNRVWGLGFGVIYTYIYIYISYIQNPILVNEPTTNFGTFSNAVIEQWLVVSKRPLWPYNSATTGF